ncbi:hypothetical protein H4R33_004296 [Dimargaris cristalligena]|nr:hypothetical protein H4R33_004296 [Dimargaris cristalligena]
MYRTLLRSGGGHLARVQPTGPTIPGPSPPFAAPLRPTATTPRVALLGSTLGSREQVRGYKAKLYVNSKYKKRDNSANHFPSSSSAPGSRRPSGDPMGKRQGHRGPETSFSSKQIDSLYQSIGGTGGGDRDRDFSRTDPTSTINDKVSSPSSTTAPAANDVRAAERLTNELFSRASYLDTRSSNDSQAQGGEGRNILSMEQAFRAGLLPGIDTAGEVPTAAHLRGRTTNPADQYYPNALDTTSAATATATTSLELENTPPANASLKIFNQVIYANTLAHRPAEAEKVLDMMAEYGVQPDIRTYCHVMDAYANCRDLNGVVATYERVQQAGLAVNLHCYGILTKAYIGALRLDDAFAVYDIMKKRGVRPSAPIFTQLIKAYLDVNQFQRAWQIFEHMRYEISQPDEVAFSHMIHACTLQNEVEKAINLFEEMVDAGLYLTDVTFNSLLNACAHRREYFTTAFTVLDQMRQHGIQPDAYTYNILIYACAMANDLPRARRLFLEMFEVAERNRDPRLVPNEITYSHMFLAYATIFSPVVARKIHKTKVRHQRQRTADYQVPQPIVDLLKFDTESPGLQEGSDADATAADSPPGDSTAMSTVPSPAQANGSFQVVKPDLDAEQALEQRIDVLREADRLFHFMVQHCPTKSSTSRSNGSQGPASSSSAARFTNKLLNNYLSLLANYGQVKRALHLYQHTFTQLGLQPDGWTYETMLNLCSRENRFEEGRRIWKEYTTWSQAHETSLDLPKGTAPLAAQAGEGRDQPKQRLSLEAQLSIRSDLEKEKARMEVGKAARQEYLTYRAMINMVTKQNDIKQAMALLRRLVAIPYNQQNLSLKNFRNLFNKTVELDDKTSRSELLRMCPAEDKTVRYGLARKWGSTVPWDVGITKRQVLVEEGEDS